MLLLNSRQLCTCAVDTKIYVDPARVLHFGATRSPLARDVQQRFESRVIKRIVGKLVHPLQPFIIPDRLAIPAQDIEANATYLLVRDLIHNLDAPEQSLWASRLRQDIDRNGKAAHKKRTLVSYSDVADFLENYIRPIVVSLMEHGWREDVADIGTAVVLPSGDLMKTGSGNHRFFMARVLGLPSVPVRVAGIYASYYRSRMRPPMTTRRIAALISEVKARYEAPGRSWAAA